MSDGTPSDLEVSVRRRRDSNVRLSQGRLVTPALADRPLARSADFPQEGAEIQTRAYQWLRHINLCRSPDGLLLSVNSQSATDTAPSRPATLARFLGGDNFAVFGSTPDLVLNAHGPRFVAARRPHQAVTLFCACRVYAFLVKRAADWRHIGFDFPRLSGR